MKLILKAACFIILSLIILSCSQKDQIESKHDSNLNEKLKIISYKLSIIESVLERASFDDENLASLKTNKNILGPIIESGVIDRLLEYSNLERLEKRISAIEQSRHDESKVQIDPFEESIYPVKTRYGTLVLWMKSAQNNVGGTEVKLKIVNTLSVDVGDVVLFLNADCKRESKTPNNIQYSSLAKLEKIGSGEAGELSILFNGVKMQDVDRFVGSIGLTRIYLK
jgi:hypothetical protein